MTSLLPLLLFVTPAMADEEVSGIDAVVVVVEDDHCVERAGLVALVELRAGVGSVVDEGPRVLSVAFAGAAPRVEVTLTLTQDGRPAGARRLGPFADCGAALEAAALGIALVIDPFGPPAPVPSPSPPTPSPPPPPPPPSPPSAAAAADVVEVPRRPAALRPFRVGVGAGIGVGSGFGVSGGPMGLVRLHFDAGVVPLVVGVGGRVDVPGPLVIDGARTVESVGGAFFVEGCGRVGAATSVLVHLCGLGQAGGMRAVGLGFERPQPVTARLVGVGAALVARAPLWSGLGVFARVGVDVPVLRARLVDGGVVHWESPLLAGQLAVGVDGLSGAR